jgi:hypothetical protein
MSQGVYLFCLTPATPLLQVEGTGIDPAHPLVAEAVAGVTAVLCAVSLEDFSGAAARDRLADLAWVAPRALRHEAVIMAALRQAPVLPVRFGSVFSSAAALAAVLERHREVLAEFFRATAGQQEWTLKAYADMAAVKARWLAAGLAAAKNQPEDLSPGKRYFQEQKIKGRVAGEVSAWLGGIADETVAAFQAVASASSRCRLLGQELTGRDDEMFLHAALLVPEASVARLQHLTGEWNARHGSAGLRLEPSGPWPPYHFTPVLDLRCSYREP